MERRIYTWEIQILKTKDLQHKQQLTSHPRKPSLRSLPDQLISTSPSSPLWNMKTFRGSQFHCLMSLWLLGLTMELLTMSNFTWISQVIEFCYELCNNK